MEAAREALRLNSPSAATRVNLAENLQRLNRFAEAKEVSEAALQRGLDNLLFYDYLYRIAFINGDGSTTQRQLDAMAARPDAYMSLDWQAAAFAFQGQLHKAQDFSQRARQSIASGAKGLDFRYGARAAFRGAVLNHCAEARSEALPAETADIDQAGLEPRRRVRLIWRRGPDTDRDWNNVQPLPQVHARHRDRIAGGCGSARTPKRPSSKGHRRSFTAATNDSGVIFLPNGGQLAISVYLKASTRNDAARDYVIAQAALAAFEKFKAD